MSLKRLQTATTHREESAGRGTRVPLGEVRRLGMWNVHSAEVGEALDGEQLKVAREVFVEDGEWTLVSVEDMVVNLDVVAHEAEAGG